MDTTGTILHRFVFAMLCIVLAGPLVPPVSAKDDDSESSDGHDGNPLHARMEAIGDSFGHLARALQKAPAPAQTAQYLKWAEALHTNLKAAHQLTPAHAQALGDKERAAMNTAFKKDMTAAAVTAQKLVAALKKDDLKQAATLITKLKVLRNAAHEKHRESDHE